jgi:hypothetical protein
MYILFLTTLIMLDGNMAVKQSKIETFGTVIECSIYKKKLEAQMADKLKTEAMFLDCRREL